MNKSALLFPGQGSQFIGMGLELYDAYDIAKDVFKEVDDSINFSLTKLMNHGDLEELTMTVNAQPAIMAVSIAVFRVLSKNLNLDVLSNVASFAAGHSLGEYSALCGVGAFSLSQTSKLLKTRGEAMQNSVPYGAGGMLALVNTDESSSNSLAKESSKIGVCEMANDNGAGQFVLSGEISAIEYAEKASKDFGIKRAVKLNVSAPFHSSMMKPASEIMNKALSDLEISELEIPVVANFTAEPNQNKSRIKDLLVNQVCGKVRWRETINFLYNQGVRSFIEVGPGKVLTTLAKRMYPECEVFNLSNPEGLDNYCNTINR